MLAKRTAVKGIPLVSAQALLVTTALALWTSVAVAAFAPNRLILASWFVVTHLLMPIAFFLLGWMCNTMFFKTSPLPATRLLSLHLGILVAVFVCLPVPLAVLNLLPIGQTTEPWHGYIVAHEQLKYNGTQLRASTVNVTSKALGPHLRFSIYNEEYQDVILAEAFGTPLTVEGFVVRGLMCVPIAVRLEPFQSEARRRAISTFLR
jgi:uncharacterized membrane protein YhdT